jgi:DNA polymerase
LLEELHEGIRECTACRLHCERTHAVPGEGRLSVPVMFIGEAPGANEDREGRPFIGRAGQFLDQLLLAVGLDRQSVFITSSVKCRPPGNRTPKHDELETCRRLWLERQIELVDPGIIVLLGKTPLRQLFGEKKASLADLHGTVRERQGRRYLLTYHPAAAMRFPTVRCAMQEDFRKLTEVLGS